MAEIALKSLPYLHLMGAKNSPNFGGEMLFPFLKWEMSFLFPPNEPLFVRPGRRRRIWGLAPDGASLLAPGKTNGVDKTKARRPGDRRRAFFCWGRVGAWFKETAGHGRRGVDRSLARQLRGRATTQPVRSDSPRACNLGIRSGNLCSNRCRLLCSGKERYG